MWGVTKKGMCLRALPVSAPQQLMVGWRRLADLYKERVRAHVCTYAGSFMSTHMGSYLPYNFLHGSF